MLSKKQLEDVCLIGDKTYKKCRFLSQDEKDPTKYHCAKKTTDASIVNVTVEDYIKSEKAKGRDPKKNTLPIGDNCEGYPILWHKLQGYDQK